MLITGLVLDASRLICAVACFAYQTLRDSLASLFHFLFPQPRVDKRVGRSRGSFGARGNQLTMAALRQMLPSSLYSPACGPIVSAPQPADSNVVHPSAKQMLPRRAMAAASPGEKKKVEMYSPEFYRASVIGGILSCGLTHTAVRTSACGQAVPSAGCRSHRIARDGFADG